MSEIAFFILLSVYKVIIKYSPKSIGKTIQKAWTLRCIDFQGIAKHPINHIQQ